ncbi:hypothetical protein SDC9_199813 [bioreactor metagenome]|uniref:Uncharacterized protein n=1 Tax=bioreactor metagenome TaxID=1076179 RepID=A0A645IP35_9ZZZZ
MVLGAMAVDDPRQDGRMRLDLGILRNQDPAAEDQFQRLRSAGLHSRRPHRSAVVEHVFEFVEVERLQIPLPVALGAVAFEQHDRQIRNLRHLPGAAGGRGLVRVEPFVIVDTEQTPAEFNLRRFAGSGRAGVFEKGPRILFQPDLLGEQRAEPPGQ